ncbi:hypothetical protein [Actinoplanes sp. NPDC051494]|uniref:hypothetical protein n=1 Tax=Actinoplanes sp. NPDC051494 TaxID=3363907 RepID=UPI0037AC007E
MRFFSNDAREATDDNNDDRTERIQSDPVAVPGQRPPSPWATPAEGGAVSEAETDDPDRTQQVTAYGTPTEPVTDPWTPPQRDTGTPAGVVESPSEKNTTTYGGSSVTQAPDTQAPERTRDEVDTDDVVDVPLDDDARTGHDETDTDLRPEDDETKDEPVDTAKLDKNEPALKDEGDFEDPKAVDPVTEKPLDADKTDEPVDEVPAKDDEPVDAEPVVAEPVAAEPVVPVPVGNAKHAAEPAGPDSDTFFSADDAAGLKERWRDVQLRFVDSPKEATDEAAKLVEEAVDKLTASLKSRKDGLTGDSEDTEALRVQLRGYRDILNRITGL